MPAPFRRIRSGPYHKKADREQCRHDSGQEHDRCAPRDGPVVDDPSKARQTAATTHLKDCEPPDKRPLLSIGGTQAHQAREEARAGTVRPDGEPFRLKPLMARAISEPTPVMVERGLHASWTKPTTSNSSLCSSSTDVKQPSRYSRCLET